MGPRRWCRGRPSQDRDAWRLESGFNGATTKVSWKALRRASSTDGQRLASMGPRRRCRGRPAYAGDELSDRRTASMGPRRWCRGRLGGRDRETTLVRASMGPRRRCRGRRFAEPLELPVNCRLQWGHDEGVVEGVRVQTRLIDGKHASMGPRRRCRGRLRHDRSRLSANLPSFNGATTKVSWKATRTEFRMP